LNYAVLARPRIIDMTELAMWLALHGLNGNFAKHVGRRRRRRAGHAALGFVSICVGSHNNQLLASKAKNVMWGNKHGNWFNSGSTPATLL
jgi:hypothetical protein